MAFVANNEDEEEKKQGAVSPTGGAVHLAPSSGVGSSGPGGVGGGSPKEAGGSFASLDKYLNANQGQAEPLAGKITDQIGQQYSSLDQANQGVLQNIQGQVMNAPGYTKGDADLLAEESANPTSFAGDQGKVSAFQKQLTNSYGGPNSAEGTNEYQTQQAKLNDAISQGQAQTTTAAGRQQLVAKNSAIPTTGVTALNSAILSQSPTALQSVQDAYKPFSNLVSGLSTGAQGVDKTIASEQADATNSSKAAKDAVTGQMTGLNTAVQNQLVQQQAAATAQNKAVRDNLASGNIGAQDLQALGITQEQWDSLSGAQKAAATSQLVSSADNKWQANTGTANVDLTSWLQQQDPNAVYNVGNTATADQYGQAKAFQTLLNGLNLDTPQLAINPADAAKAGTAPKNLSSFGYDNALQSTQDTAAAEKAAGQAYVDALQAGADEDHARAQAANAAKNANMVMGGSSALIGAGAPGAIAAGAGIADSVKNDISNPTLKHTADIVNSTMGPKLVSNAAQGVAKGVTSAASTVTNMFCFHPWTLVDMMDGSSKPICQVLIGDETRGGKVLATTRGAATEFYWYFGVLVTGKHAVKENGVWMRIESSTKAQRFPYLTEVVCNLVTDKHRIWANGVEFADFYETDLYESLDLAESLAEMNKNG